MKLKTTKEKPKMGFKRAFRRLCRDCDEYFLPDGKYTRFCDNCFYKRVRKSGKKNPVTDGRLEEP